MPKYQYEAVDSSGKTIKNSIEADNEKQVLDRLHQSKLHIVSVSEQKAGLFSPGGKKTVGSPKLYTLVIFSRQFATLIDAGLPVSRCLDILYAQSKDPVLKPAIMQIKNDVQGGLSLGDSVAKHPNCFSKLYVSMIRAAEIGGILDLILDRLAGFLEKELEIKQKVQAAMMYPIIVLVFANVMVVALFMFVLPKFKEIFASMGVEMPAMTLALFAMSDFMVKFWYLVVGIPIALVFAVKQYNKTKDGRLKIDTIKLKAPIFGDLILKLAVGRFTRTFGTLISSGVPMMRAMEIVSEASANQVLINAIDHARDGIRDGQRLAVPLAASSVFPPMVTHMVDIGEETGRMSEMLVKIADFYDKEVDAAVKGLTSMIEPLLIVGMGCFVGFVAIAVMGPIFKLISAIS
jgi:type IV pilus assembly protein PilC